VLSLTETTKNVLTKPKFMKSVLKIFVPLISIGLFLPVFAFAQTPSLPHQFFGTVNFTNGAAPNGLAVEARITSTVVGSSITANGNYGYNSNPNPENAKNLLVALDNQGVNAGKTIEFYVSGIKANETAIFTNGDSSRLNLTIPAAIPAPPAPIPTLQEALVVAGGGVTTTTTISTSPLSATAQKVDANKDNKIDKYDFSLMMANWGKAGSNVADFNGDNKVDKYDFALLMANWSI
jgi:hypothetical protein